MKERPILFSAPMVRAILEGRKTQTRRIVKPQPEKLPIRVQEAALAVLHEGKFHFQRNDGTLIGAWEKQSPYGQPGDRLWVREKIFYSENNGVYEYAADNKTVVDAALEWRATWAYEGKPIIPSIHMPRAASRILLEVLDVRVERLQEISEDDAISEGVYFGGPEPTYQSPDDGNPDEWVLPLESFTELWQSINGPESWDENPWVWVITFKKI